MKFLVLEDIVNADKQVGTRVAMLIVEGLSIRFSG